MEPTHSSGLSANEKRRDDLALFGIGLAVGGGVGVLISFIWDVAVIDGIGLALGVYGGILLATGGASGGGYRNMGSATGDRLTVRPRNEVTPKSLRQVVSGTAYLTIGIGLAVLFG